MREDALVKSLPPPGHYERKTMKNKPSEFWEQVEENKRIVKSWPEWMQKITINAESCQTGCFISKGKEQ